MNNDHPVYDCLYVVCARRNDGILLSKDKKLRMKMGEESKKLYEKKFTTNKIIKQIIKLYKD